MEKIDYRVLITGIIAITIIELYALSKGINGIILTIVVGIIASAIGISIPKEKIIRG